MRSSIPLVLLLGCRDKAPEPLETARPEDSRPTPDSADSADTGEETDSESGESGDPIAPVLPPGRLQGVVRDVEGAPIPGVTLSVGSRSATTDEIGFYWIDEVSEGDALVRAEVDGYSTGFAWVTVPTEAWGFADLTLLPAKDYNWDPESGEPVITDEGAEIVLPIGGLLDAFGLAHDGVVTVRVSVLDALSELDAAPSAMASLGEDGEPVLLETAGGMEVRLFDAAGLPLTLAEPAQISWDLLDAERLGLDEDFGLYGFDEATGLWVEEPGGSIEEGRFVAEVAHFSWWSADDAMGPDACLIATFTYGGALVEGAVVSVALEGRGISTTRRTGADGRIALSLLGDHTWTVSVSDGLWYLDDQDVYVEVAPDGPCTDAGSFELTLIDLDGDSVPSEASGGADCDDADPEVSPLEDEIWYDGTDQDCDGNDADQDGDGYLVLGYSGAVTDGFYTGDCDDLDDRVHPDRVEFCDGVDQNCDGDEADASDATTWYTDADGDGFGVDDSAVWACEAPSGAVDVGGDCLDDPALDPDGLWHPSADEACGDPDYNCDGDADLEDSDGDGMLGCEGDCDDLDPAVYLGATESCDALDNDCDGEVDGDSVETTFYRDDDLDGFGDPEATLSACTAPEGYVEEGEDCDDTDEDTWPGAPEICEDGVINSCTRDADEATRLCSWTDEPALTYSLAREGIKGEVANVGDATGDGLDDLVFTTAEVRLLPGSSETGELDFTSYGWSLVHSGSGVSAGSLGALGDADGDGYADVALGAIRSVLGEARAGGTAFLLYGPISADLRLDDAELLVSSASGSYTGSDVGGAGDLDGDGLPNLMVGASGERKLGVFGEAPEGDRLLSEAAWLVTGTSTTGALSAQAGGGDVDGDGQDDLVYAAMYAAVGGVSLTGQIFVHLAPDPGSYVPEDADIILDGTDDASFLGYSIGRALDADGDGLDDLYAAINGGLGAWFVSGAALRSGSIDAVATGLLYGAPIYRFAADGDLDADGLGDAILGGNGSPSLIFGAPVGSVDVETLAPHIIPDAGGDYFGDGFAMMKDLGGDGLGEIVITSPTDYAGEDREGEELEQIFVYHSGSY